MLRWDLSLTTLSFNLVSNIRPSSVILLISIALIWFEMDRIRWSNAILSWFQQLLIIWILCRDSSRILREWQRFFGGFPAILREVGMFACLYVCICVLSVGFECSEIMISSSWTPTGGTLNGIDWPAYSTFMADISTTWMLRTIYSNILICFEHHGDITYGNCNLIGLIRNTMLGEVTVTDTMIFRYKHTIIECMPLYSPQFR